MARIPIVYEVPLILFLIIAIYVIYQLFLERRYLAEGPLRDSHKWLIIGTIFLMLWSIDHLYHDLVPLPENLITFFHYIISHGALLIAMICIGITAYKTRQVYSSITKNK